MALSGILKARDFVTDEEIVINITDVAKLLFKGFKRKDKSH